jgi:ACS family glucarate transporter-like MFS transporter
MARYAVVAALFVLSLITYIDRAAISSAKGAVAADLGLSDESMGAVFSAFALGYAIAQVPAGWLADRYGPRLALALVVAVWSAFTGFTGLVHSLGPLLAVRFLFGIAEAGAFPGAARAFYNWLPTGERGRANGIIFAGARLGAALAFPVMAWLLVEWNWRVAFYLLAIPGLAWALGWALWFRNLPRKPLPPEPGVAAPQLPLGTVLRMKGILLAMVQYFCSNFTSFMALSWMNPYLRETYRLTAAEAATYSMAPFVCGAFAQWATGTLVDRLYRSRYRAWSRRLPPMIGFTVASTGILLVPQMGSAFAAAACFTLATFGAEMTISPSWVYCMDLAGKNSGSVTGTMNMIGNFGSFVSANAFPWLRGMTGTPAAYFVAASGLNALGLVCWWLMRPAGASAQPRRAAP